MLVFGDLLENKCINQEVEWQDWTEAASVAMMRQRKQATSSPPGMEITD